LSNEVILVPDIKGISLQEAKKILSEKVLNLLAVSIEDCKTPEDSAAAKIYKQTPEGNGTNTITIGGTINIWLSSNPLKKAEPDSIGSN
jgi:beta-lactam-binding protein with PASTA domain